MGGSLIRSARALAVLAASLSACAAGKSQQNVPNADAAPAFTAAERKILASMELKSSAAPADPTNAFADNPRAAELGQRFFFHKGFSGPLLESDNDGTPETLGKRGETGRVSCAGCHVPGSGFMDNRSRGQQVSLASGWGVRRTPALLDVGHRKLLTWIGKADGLFNQVFGVFENENEGNTSRLFVAHEVFRTFRAPYEAVFGAMPPLGDAARFPVLEAARAGCDPPAPLQAPVCRGRPGDAGPFDGMKADDQSAVTRVVVNVGKAIGAYLRRLSCGRSRFDAWIAGNAAALNASEQRGAAVFLGKAHCVECHSGPFFTDFQFHNVGLTPAPVAIAIIDQNDRGAADGIPLILASPINSKSSFSDADDARLPSAPTPAMVGAFETPMLRCLKRNPSFMHTGQLRKLEDVIGFFNAGGSPTGYPGTNELKTLGLTAAEQADLLAFLLALEGPGPSPDLTAAPP